MLNETPLKTETEENDALMLCMALDRDKVIGSFEVFIIKISN